MQVSLLYAICFKAGVAVYDINFVTSLLMS